MDPFFDSQPSHAELPQFNWMNFWGFADQVSDDNIVVNGVYTREHLYADDFRALIQSGGWVSTLEGLLEGLTDKLLSDENIEEAIGSENETETHSRYDPSKVKFAGETDDGVKFVVTEDGEVLLDRDGNGKYDLAMAKNAVSGQWEYYDGDTDGWQPMSSMNSNENGWLGSLWDQFVDYLENCPQSDYPYPPSGP